MSIANQLLLRLESFIGRVEVDVDAQQIPVVLPVELRAVADVLQVFAQHGRLECDTAEAPLDLL